MRIQRDDDHDLRELIEHGASSWHGPSPFAGQSSWAAEAARRHRVHAAARGVAGLGVAALVAGSVTLLATSQSPAGAAASVVRLVSHVLTGPAGGQPVVPPSPAVPPPSPAPRAGAPAPSRAPEAAARSTPQASPSPTRWAEQEDRRPTPSPSPSASSLPSLSPSRPPGE